MKVTWVYMVRVHVALSGAAFTYASTHARAQVWLHAYTHVYAQAKASPKSTGGAGILSFLRYLPD